MSERMKRIPVGALRRLTALLLVLLLAIPACAPAEEEDDWDEAGWDEEDWDEEDDEDWENWEPDDWESFWEEEGFFDFCGVEDGTLTIFEGVTSIGMDWHSGEGSDEAADPGPGLQLDRSFSPVFRRVVLPSTLRRIDSEAFISYHFETFTISDSLEALAEDAFVHCTFDVLRIESAMPVETVLDSLYDCSVIAFEVPEDHPLLRSVDGVLFSKDGKTLLSYPGGRTDTHYDVPAGVERIANIHNESLQTVSLPIGLRSVDDFAFSFCTRLQAIALPLTVRELGRDVFYCCVSLETVSLPDGLTAERDEDGRDAEYYADDALFRGDNGDTLGGARSEGRIAAPGRLYAEPSAVPGRQALVRVYDTADGQGAPRWYRSGKTVWMGRYQNGRVALYEPLGGTYTGSDGWGAVLGWTDIANVRYLNPQTLFTYAEVRPRGTMNVWWNHLPDYAYWTPWETVLPQDGRTCKATLFGAYVRFDDPKSHAVFGCAIQDADLTRVPDGTDNVYGIVFNPAFMEDVPLRAEPDGGEAKMLCGGTQVEILAEEGGWVQVTDGTDTGWVKQDHVRVIPEEQEDDES
ncbi:MAG: leucine-rich repeat protein [Clostridia bacterium]|nr:leucine-rich repeat protein [Clostridia bacterium]